MKYYELDGQKKTITQWAKEAGISRQAMSRRIAKAKTEDELRIALTFDDFQGASLHRKTEKVLKKKARLEHEMANLLTKTTK